jgi:hypothetical protein
MTERKPNPPYQALSDQLADKNAGYSDCIGFEEISVNDSTVQKLSIPNGATSALITVVADPSTTDLRNVVWWKEDGNVPTTGANGEGMPLGHLGVYECKGVINLKNFQVIGIEAGKTHSVRISYY